MSPAFPHRTALPLHLMQQQVSWPTWPCSYGLMGTLCETHPQDIDFPLSASTSGKERTFTYTGVQLCDNLADTIMNLIVWLSKHQRW